MSGWQDCVDGVQCGGVLYEIGMGGFTSTTATGRYLASLLMANDIGILVAAIPELNSSRCMDKAEGV
ncbi:UNVERIFIED_CONTAM: hypothetical protein Sradi_0095400 [Sesamum radiatum]|uniref:Uncharacterized protein n=1 Tax=Sesamum radiatum TaxID=300843 RepID=A0AAW2WIA0_SESRA